jgi:hypothetical protein
MQYATGRKIIYHKKTFKLKNDLRIEKKEQQEQQSNHSVMHV